MIHTTLLVLLSLGLASLLAGCVQPEPTLAPPSTAPAPAAIFAPTEAVIPTLTAEPLKPTPPQISAAIPTPTPTVRPAPEPTTTPSPEPTVPPISTPTPTPEPTAAPSTPTPAPTPEPAATAIPTASPTPEPTAAPTPTPEPTAIPTPTPTPGPLSAADIYERLSPAVALVSTNTKEGSGVLIQGGYVLTNAHVVWPFRQADLTFPDGSRRPSVPVVGWDLVADLAVLGPVDVKVAPAVFTADQEARIGSDVYLIGHVGSQEGGPKPTISPGLVTQAREWRTGGIGYLYTDIRMQAGQSGGLLLSDRGEVLGTAGHVVTRDDFALGSAADDVLQRTIDLTSSDPASGPGPRMIPLSGGSLEHDLELGPSALVTALVLNSPVGTEFDIAAATDGRASLSLWAPNGQQVARTNLDESRDGTMSGVVRTEGPHILTVSGISHGPNQVHLTSSLPLIRYVDPDDRPSIALGTTVRGAIDYRSDRDRMVLELQEGESVDLTVDSIGFNPALQIGFLGAPSNQITRSRSSDAQSLAHNASITYRAPFTGAYVISVSGGLPGYGYVLSVAKATDDAGALTVKPSKRTSPAPANLETKSERDMVQAALAKMMSDAGISQLATSTNSVNSWAHYPQDTGATPLHPESIAIPHTRYFYCWESEGRVTYQFTNFAVCPPPPLPPGTPYDGMRQPRLGHTASRLEDGRVLVVGGEGTRSDSVASTEVFDPESGKWTESAQMATGRALQTATLLGDGRVLVTGGQSGFEGVASAEVYDPEGDSWSSSVSMTQARFYHSATRLSDGTVLVAGGTRDFDRVHDSAETYDPANNTWTDAGRMAGPRALHTATLLQDGRLLVAGGLGTSQRVSASAGIFDPSDGTWQSTGSMAQPRVVHTATLLLDGRVLVAGGFGGGFDALEVAEVYDPASGEWSPAGNMVVRRVFHAATLLADGRVLVVGGQGDFGESSSASEAYDPSTGEWSSVADMTDSRGQHTATLLADGRVIVIGGESDFGGPLDSSEVYDPEADAWTFIEGLEPPIGQQARAGAPAPAAPAVAPAPAAPAPTARPRPAPTVPVAQGPSACACPGTSCPGSSSGPCTRSPGSSPSARPSARSSGSRSGTCSRSSGACASCGAHARYCWDACLWRDEGCIHSDSARCLGGACSHRRPRWKRAAAADHGR